MRIASCLLLATIALPGAAQAVSHYYSDQHFINFDTDYTTTVFAPAGYTTSAGRVAEYNGPMNFAVNLEYERYGANPVGSSRVDLQACKLEYSIVSPK